MKGSSLLNASTDSAAHKAALEDPDAQPQTKEELERFKRVNPFANKS